MSSLRCLSCALAAVLGAACGAPASAPPPAGTGTPDAGDPGGGGDVPADVFPAAHPALPQVVTEGGPVLGAPRIVPVFFANDDAAVTSQIEAFLTSLGATDYWTAATSEYGVGPATSAPAVHLAESASATVSDTAIDGWIRARIAATELPAPDDDTVYVIHYPRGTKVVIHDASGLGHSCTDFGGYHADLTLRSGRLVAYVILPRCPASDGLTELENLTASEGHELVEAATNPYPDLAPAWSAVASDDAYWNLANQGTEIADLCQNDPQAYLVLDDPPFTVPRVWSNAAARAGHDPCVPAFAGEVFFNAVPDLPDAVSIPLWGQQLAVKSFHVPAGDSRTIPLHLYADAPTSAAWTVAVMDQHEWDGDGSADVTFALDRPTGRNGDELQLTATTVRQSAGRTDLFYVVSSLGQEQHVWVGLVDQ